MENRKILAADKDTRTTEAIKSTFVSPEEVNNIVFQARSADAVIDLAWQKKPDIIIVSTILLDLSGWEVLGILQKNEPTRLIPFIMLGNNGRYIEEEIRALNLGAYDYINKPINSELLRARVDVILRYRSANKTGLRQVLKTGKIVINMDTHTVYVNKKAIDLTPKEFALLHLFMKKRNRVLNRVYLSGTIWEREYFQTSHTIDRHIANLRKKLGQEGRRIETLHAIGYKFS